MIAFGVFIVHFDNLFLPYTTLQTLHVYSTLKRRGNECWKSFIMLKNGETYCKDLALFELCLTIFQPYG